MVRLKENKKERVVLGERDGEGRRDRFSLIFDTQSFQQSFQFMIDQNYGILKDLESLPYSFPFTFLSDQTIIKCQNPFTNSSI